MNWEQFREIVEEHKSKYDARYIDSEGNTYYAPDRLPMSRGEFYDLMHDIYEKIKTADDDELWRF